MNKGEGARLYRSNKFSIGVGVLILRAKERMIVALVSYENNMCVGELDMPPHKRKQDELFLKTAHMQLRCQTHSARANRTRRSGRFVCSFVL